ncbi:MAG: PDZ domain-containing protein [Myxococcota bacterium]
MRRSWMRWSWAPIGLVLWVPVVPLGLAGLVHAAGHWIAARLLGLDVRFSFGTGFVVHEWSDRVRLSGFPGAYTTPVIPLTPSLRSCAFLAAGPFANLVAAAFVPAFALTLIAMFVVREPAPVVAYVEPLPEASPFRVGDRIEAIDGRPTRTWTQVAERFWEAEGPTMSVALVRDGRTITLDVEPTAAIHASEPAPVLGIDDPSSPLGRAGLATGDTVVMVDGRAVQNEADLVAALEGVADNDVELGIEGEGVVVVRRATSHEAWGRASAATFVERVLAGAPADTAGIVVGDRLVAVDGVAVLGGADLLSRIHAGDGRHAVTLRRAGVSRTVDLVLGPGPLIGVVLHDAWRETPMLADRCAVVECVRMGIESTRQVLGGAMRSLGAVLTGRASHLDPRERGLGPRPVRVTSPGPTDSLRRLGFVFMGANLQLWFYNLLPFPWSDGRRFAELVIEAATGRVVRLQGLSWALLVLPFGLVFATDLIRFLDG